MIKEVRITDPDTIRLVEAEKSRRGDATATKTAANLIRERATLLEQLRIRGCDSLAIGEAPTPRIALSAEQLDDLCHRTAG